MYQGDLLRCKIKEVKDAANNGHIKRGSCHMVELV